MKKILAFADVHLGIRTHSIQQSSGLFDAEVEARIALEEVYNRACQDDINAVICAGDLFHTSHPTTENIRYLIGWLEKMNKLDKWLFILPGNHDAGIHSHSMIFIKELNLTNIELIDSDNLDIFFRFGEWQIAFAPYIVSDTAKDREITTYDLVDEGVKNCSTKTILITHIHEREAKIGSEGIMLARQVPHIDFDKYDIENEVILLTGHIHKHQIYNKNNGVKVVYPGSLFYHDKHDVNQNKGYILINEAGDIEFESINNIRKFVSYKVPKEVHPLDFLKSFRLGINKYIFLNVESDEKINDIPIRAFLKTKNCKLGNILYTTEDMVFNTDININCAETDPYLAFNEYLEESSKVEKFKHLKDLKKYSDECIKEARGL